MFAFHNQYVLLGLANPLRFQDFITATCDWLSQQLIYFPYASFNLVHISVALHSIMLLLLLLLLILRVLRLLTLLLLLLGFGIVAIWIAIVRNLQILFILLIVVILLVVVGALI